MANPPFTVAHYNDPEPMPTTAPTPPASPEPAANGPWSAVTRHFPPGQFLRYLAVGGFNTVFGYATYAGFTALLTPLLPHAYLAAVLLSNVVSISAAFLGYKWFIFKTQGNYRREWARCLLVYSSLMVVNLIVLPLLVWLVRRLGADPRTAPYLAGALLMGGTVLFSFVAHKQFSFRAPAS